MLFSLFVFMCKIQNNFAFGNFPTISKKNIIHQWMNSLLGRWNDSEYNTYGYRWFVYAVRIQIWVSISSRNNFENRRGICKLCHDLFFWLSIFIAKWISTRNDRKILIHNLVFVIHIADKIANDSIF